MHSTKNPTVGRLVGDRFWRRKRACGSQQWIVLWMFVCRRYCRKFTYPSISPTECDTSVSNYDLNGKTRIDLTARQQTNDWKQSWNSAACDEFTTSRDMEKAVISACRMTSRIDNDALELSDGVQSMHKRVLTSSALWVADVSVGLQEIVGRLCVLCLLSCSDESAPSQAPVMTIPIKPWN